MCSYLFFAGGDFDYTVRFFLGLILIADVLVYMDRIFGKGIARYWNLIIEGVLPGKHFGEDADGIDGFGFADV